MKLPSLIASNFRWLSAKFSFLLPIPLLLGLVLVPTLSAIAAPLTSHNPAGGLLLTGVVSTKTHGGSGSFDINLPLSGTPGIECRSGGVNLNHTLVFTFNHNMDPNASTSVTVPPGTGSVVPPLIFSGSTMRVNLTGVVNAQTITITVIGAKDEFGQVLPDTDVRMSVLLGDSTGEGLVNSSDIVLIKGGIGSVTDATNFRLDLNLNGTINAADIALAKSRSGTALPGVTIVPGSSTQSLSFFGPTTIDLGTATTFTVSAFLDFSGYSSAGLSYWMETDNALAPFIKTGNLTYFTFTDPNQTTPNPASFNSTTGATSGFLTEPRDLGATDPTASVVSPGIYHITDLTFCLDPHTPNGTYTLRSTTAGPRFSEVSDGNFQGDHTTPASAFTFTVTGTGPSPTPPCGVISGKITDAQGPLQGARVQACRVAPVPACLADNGCLPNATTNASGDYQITGVPLNTPFNLTVFPPSGSVDLPGGLLNRSVTSCGTPLTDQDVMLQQPVLPPPQTGIEPHTNGAGGVPSVYWGSSLTLTAIGCSNGTGSFAISDGSSTFASGSMMETPAGSGVYKASVPPLNPAHGAATVTMTIQSCPGPTTITFNIYIDPSGIVQDSHGALLAGATVTLLRSDTAAGPFNIVPDGSAVMSPGNRQNPDVTDAQGHFGWDVLTGFYKVRASKSGCNGMVETGALPIPPPVTDLVLTLDCPTQLVTAVSRKAHGAAGVFSIPLPLSGHPGVECRTGEVNGNHTLVFTFSDNIVNGSASLTSGTGSVAAPPGFAGQNMTVNLAGVTDVQKITVTLSGVTDSFAQILPDSAVSVNMLIGDTSGNKAVNSSDVSQTKLQSGQTVTATNFREDVNANGSINATDVGTVKLKVGTALP